jgi:hypothetical protein
MANDDGTFIAVTGQPFTIALEAPLGKGFDADGDPLRIVSLAAAPDGTVAFDASGDGFLSIDGDRMVIGQGIDAGGGTGALSGVGRVGFTPGADQSGPAAWTCVGDVPTACFRMAVTLEIAAVNRPPRRRTTASRRTRTAARSARTSTSISTRSASSAGGLPSRSMSSGPAWAGPATSATPSSRTPTATSS